MRNRNYVRQSFPARELSHMAFPLQVKIHGQYVDAVSASARGGLVTVYGIGDVLLGRLRGTTYAVVRRPKCVQP